MCFSNSDLPRGRCRWLRSEQQRDRDRQVTPLAAINNTSSRDKSALCSDRLIPRAAIVDPQLMLSVPVGITAATGSPVFCPSFRIDFEPPQ